MSEIKTVSVIGMGYIGLPTCAIFARSGLNVIGIDVNASVVEKVNRGEIHIVEPDLDGLIQKVVANGKLKAFTTPQPADAFIIAVPTPITHDHKPDISYVLAAAKSIASTPPASPSARPPTAPKDRSPHPTPSSPSPTARSCSSKPASPPSSTPADRCAIKRRWKW